MPNHPIISWYEVDNKTELTKLIDFGVVDAGSESSQKTFHIWNNRNGAEDAPKMQDVKITTRDLDGGLGNSTGKIVQAVKDNWFRVRVDSLGEVGDSFTPIGSGIGLTSPLDGQKTVGTKGKTKNPKLKVATPWTAQKTYATGDVVLTTTNNGVFIYEATVGGLSGAVEPTWPTMELDAVTDGGVTWIAILKEKSPATAEILGSANEVAVDGSNVTDAGGNYVTITTFAKVPDQANSGKNGLMFRVRYGYV